MSVGRKAHVIEVRDTIEITASEVATELKRRGIGSDGKVILTIQPEVFAGRRASRKLVIAAGLTDDDLDQLIEQARDEVHARPE